MSRQAEALAKVLREVPAGLHERPRVSDRGELLARLTETENLLRKAQETSDRGERAALLAKSASVLTAMPRDELDEQVSDLQTKAHRADDPVLRRGYLERAELMKAQNPQPPAEVLATARRRLNKSAGAVRQVGPKSWVRDELPADEDAGQMLYKSAGVPIDEVRAMVAREVAKVDRRASARVRQLEQEIASLQKSVAAAPQWPAGVLTKADVHKGPDAMEQAEQYRRRALEVADLTLREGYWAKAREIEEGDR